MGAFSYTALASLNPISPVSHSRHLPWHLLLDFYVNTLVLKWPHSFYFILIVQLLCTENAE